MGGGVRVELVKSSVGCGLAELMAEKWQQRMLCWQETGRSKGGLEVGKGGA